MIYFDAEFNEDFGKSLVYLYSEQNQGKSYLLGGMSKTPTGAIGVVDFFGVGDLQAAYENKYPIYLTFQYDIEGSRMFVSEGIISETKLKHDSILLKLLNFNPGASV